ncbi:MAG TPA: hypothetical protein VI653_14580 [Steroidobacteraceae bacterium]
MNGRLRNKLLVALAATAGCVSVPASADEICSEIAQFANAARDHAVHVVELTADHKCNSGGYQPGDQLCRFLTSSGSPDVHIRQSLECLRDTDMERYDGRDAPYRVTIRYTSRAAEHTDNLVLVRIEYPGDTKVPNSVRISAQRVMPFRRPVRVD